MGGIFVVRVSKEEVVPVYSIAYYILSFTTSFPRVCTIVIQRTVVLNRKPRGGILLELVLYPLGQRLSKTSGSHILCKYGSTK